MTPETLTLPSVPAAAPPASSASQPAWRKKNGKRVRILLVTPELSGSDLLSRDGYNAPCIKAGGLADVSSVLLDSMAEAGADVHVAIPHYHSLYQPGDRGHSKHLHLCQDREFSYRRSVYDSCPHSNLRAALAFQRDVIHYVMPKVKPDLVHCHDWMTGLVPAAARSIGIPSLFTLHNLHDERASLSHIEDRGIDAARFWENLYFHEYPGSYEAVRNRDTVSMLASGILAADEINTVSHSFLGELAGGQHPTSWPVIDAVRGKLLAGGAHGIVNSLHNHQSPERDPFLSEKYGASNQAQAKRANKRLLQTALGLELDQDAPVLFWPSRLDPVQKGCQLLSEILYRLVSDYWALGLQVVFVGDGPYQPVFEGIRDFHGLRHRIAVHSFNESMSRLAYAGSDFTLMPSAYEPCGISQMVGMRYGSLPIVHATGGLRDTVTHLDAGRQSGNGFSFDHHDGQGLRWAIDEAMRFHLRPAAERDANISRIMREASRDFSPAMMVNQYRDIYRRLLRE